MGSADADVVEAAGHPQGEGAGVVDAVVADPVVGVGVSAVAGQRRVILPLVSTRSRRTRSWVSFSRSPGVALGRLS